jgi:arginyl-tRNA synthetase
MIKDRLAELVAEAVKEAGKAGKLPEVTLPGETIERPQNADHGDYASSVSMKLARVVGRSPMQIAETIVEFIRPAVEIDSISVAKPGFINIRLSESWLAAQTETILAAGDTYGAIDEGKGERLQIEFVSVNPTGPLHVGHARGAVLGSGLANMLSAAGYDVQREYYVNDAGNQIDLFRLSLYVRYMQSLGRKAAMPENGYQGDYMIDMAKEIIAVAGERFAAMPEAQALAELGEVGLVMMMGRISEDLDLLGVGFDEWFREKSLFETGLYDDVMAKLKAGGYIGEREGATWFMSTALGEDKDNVVVRGDGTPTYFASDIAYHYNKLAVRNFARVINIWGADHQGHISRMKAVLTALGISPERLTVLVCQMVSLRRGQELVKVSKRSGDVITLRELIDEVGRDACRYFFLSRSADSQMDFDLELAKKESPENPVYYVQYAHARIASILRLASEKGIDYSGGDVSLLTDAHELALLRKMLALEEVLQAVARTLEPHHLAFYAQELATVFHHFYDNCRVVSDDAALTGARLKLVAASKQVLARCLTLMGMNAPEKM